MERDLDFEEALFSYHPWLNNLRMCHNPPSGVSPDSVVRHEVDLVPVIKCGVIR